MYFISVLMFTGIFKCMSKFEQTLEMLVVTALYSTTDIDFFCHCVNVHWYLQEQVCKFEQALETAQHYIQQKIAGLFKHCVNVHWYLKVHVCKSEQALEMLVDMALYSTTDYRCISSLC